MLKFRVRFSDLPRQQKPRWRFYSMYRWPRAGLGTRRALTGGTCINTSPPPPILYDLALEPCSLSDARLCHGRSRGVRGAGQRSRRRRQVAAADAQTCARCAARRCRQGVGWDAAHGGHHTYLFSRHTCVAGATSLAGETRCAGRRRKDRQ